MTAAVGDRPLLLVDTASAYFRAFHGIPTTVTAPDGRPVNAVRGLLDALAHLIATRGPAELVCCWDDDWRPAWRVALVPSYKAHRVGLDGAGGDDAPPELGAQVPVIREVLAALGLPVVGAADHEADDVLATLARRGRERGVPVEVVTGDRDLFQLVRDPDASGPGVMVLYTGRGMARIEGVDAAAVRDRYGVAPARYAELATLRGDTSDGLPGVTGIGEKTAAALLGRFGSLAGIVDAGRRRRAGNHAARRPGAARRRAPVGGHAHRRAGRRGPGRPRPAAPSGARGRLAAAGRARGAGGVRGAHHPSRPRRRGRPGGVGAPRRRPLSPLTAPSPVSLLRHASRPGPSGAASGAHRAG